MNEQPFKAETATGTVYEFNGHVFTITLADGYKWALKPWQWFAFAENDPAGETGLLGLIDKAVRLEPAEGLHLLVYAKDEWRVSSRIVKVNRNVSDEDSVS